MILIIPVTKIIQIVPFHKLVIIIVSISTLEKLQSFSKSAWMENWDFSVLTGASLIPPTENKRYSYCFWCIIFFQDWGQSRLKVPSNIIRMSKSLNLDDNQHFASLFRVWMVISKTSIQRVHTFHLVHDLSKWTFSLNQRRCQTLCIYAFANHLWVRHHIKNLLDYLPLQNPCIA